MYASSVIFSTRSNWSQQITSSSRRYSLCRRQLDGISTIRGSGLRFLGAKGSISRITPGHERIAWTNLCRSSFSMQKRSITSGCRNTNMLPPSSATGCCATHRRVAPDHVLRQSACAAAQSSVTCR